MAFSNLPLFFSSLLLLFSTKNEATSLASGLTGVMSTTTPREINATRMVARFLGPHNAIRTELGLPPLQWSSQVANRAKWYAKQRKGDCELVHSKGIYGENLFWGSGKRWKVADAVGFWVAEKSAYDYEKNSCVGNEACGHYTQIVWKGTKYVGCARRTCDSGDTFIVCEYYPPGNYVGQRPF